VGYGRPGQGRFEGHHLHAAGYLLLYLYATSLDVWASHCGVMSQKTEGYCWPTPKCRNLCGPYAFLEGKKAEKTSPRKSTPRTLKEVGQQYPPVIGTRAPRGHFPSIARTETRYRNQCTVGWLCGSFWTEASDDTRLCTKSPVRNLTHKSTFSMRPLQNSVSLPRRHNLPLPSRTHNCLIFKSYLSCMPEGPHG
jgi:hypothetical protein